MSVGADQGRCSVMWDNMRFGCWTCTVVAKDRSLRGLIESGHEDADEFSQLFDFREWLIELRENDANRQRVRRDGNSKSRADGSP